MVNCTDDAWRAFFSFFFQDDDAHESPGQCLKNYFYSLLQNYTLECASVTVFRAYRIVILFFSFFTHSSHLAHSLFLISMISLIFKFSRASVGDSCKSSRKWLENKWKKKKLLYIKWTFWNVRESSWMHKWTSSFIFLLFRKSERNNGLSQCSRCCKCVDEFFRHIL